MSDYQVQPPQEMIDRLANEHDIYSIQDNGRMNPDVLHGFIYDLFLEFANSQAKEKCE